MQDMATHVTAEGFGPNSAPHHQERQAAWARYAVLMLGAPLVVAWFTNAEKLDRTVMLGVQCLIWAVAGALLAGAVARQRDTAFASHSRMSQSFVVFLAAFVVATGLVWWNSLRSDMAALSLQSAALLFMTLPFFALQRAAKAQRVDRAVLLTCHLILLLGLLSILSDFFGVYRHEGSGHRYFGPLGDQVAWALTLPFTVYFATRRIPLALLAGVGLALTASRGPALITITAALLLLFFSRARRFEFGSLMVMLLVLSIYQSGLLRPLAARVSSTQLTANDRTTTAALGVKIFLRSPVFGSGYNSLTHFYPTRAVLVRLGILPGQTSTFVQMLSDGGLLCFAPYLFFVLATTMTSVALMRHWQQLPYGRLMSGVAAWVLAMLWLDQSALWFVVGSYVGPLVLGMAGIVAAGANLLLKSAQYSSKAGFPPAVQWPLSGPAH